MNPLKCPLCPTKPGGKPVKYPSRAEVLKHVAKRHDVKLYHCSDCDATFVDEVIHRKFHDDFHYVCNFCNAPIKIAGGYINHVKEQHGAKIGLHPAAATYELNLAVLPSKGDELMNRAKQLGIRGSERMESKDYFVILKEDGNTVVTVHPITYRSSTKEVGGISRHFPTALLREGRDISHICMGADFKYDELAYLASFDDSNWVYLEPTVNRGYIGSFEMFTRNTLGRKWNELLIVTVVTYRAGENRDAAKIGKAILMTRDGENPKALCFIFQNEVSAKGFWSCCKSLEQFRVEMRQPDLFRTIFGLKDCSELKMLKCMWMRCPASFETRREVDDHHKICPFQHYPKARKRDVDNPCVPVPCLNCLVISHDLRGLESHEKTVHREARSRKKSDDSTMRERSRSPHRPSASSVETIDFEEAKEDDKTKIIKIIQAAPLTGEDIDDIVAELNSKRHVNQ